MIMFVSESCRAITLTEWAKCTSTANTMPMYIDNNTAVSKCYPVKVASVLRRAIETVKLGEILILYNLKIHKA